MQDIMQLCDVIRETGFAIHRYHRNGHLEKIYENALVHRLRKQGLQLQQQHPLKVLDEDGTLLGDFYADLLVENAAELAFVDQLLGQDDGRTTAIIVPDHVRHFRLLDSGDHLLRLIRVQRERLFAEDHLAGFRRVDRNLGVGVVRRADVDEVDVLPRDQLSPIGLD